MNAPTSTTIPATRNPEWGFWGTMGEHAPAAWPLAMTAISDDVHNGLCRGQTLADAINAATRQWMGWTIGRQTSKQYGIPRGLPYLTGFVIHCEIAQESLAA